MTKKEQQPLRQWLRCSKTSKRFSSYRATPPILSSLFNRDQPTGRALSSAGREAILAPGGLFMPRIARIVPISGWWKGWSEGKCGDSGLRLRSGQSDGCEGSGRSGSASHKRACNDAEGSRAPWLKPDDLCATYRGLEPAATPKSHVSWRPTGTLISDAPH